SDVCSSDLLCYRLIRHDPSFWVKRCDQITNLNVFDVSPAVFGQYFRIGMEALVLVDVGLSLTVPKLQHRTILEVPRLLAGSPLANAARELLQAALDQRPIQLRKRAAQKQSLVAGSLHALDKSLPQQGFGLAAASSPAVQHHISRAGVEHPLAFRGHVYG